MNSEAWMSAPKSMQNIIPKNGGRYESDANKFGLMSMDHFALPARNLPLLERFVREILGGIPYCYAGFDQQDKELGRKPHIFLRIGDVLLQCTEELWPGQLDPKDTNLTPHWAFRVSAADIDTNIGRLRKIGIPVQGPMHHRGMDLISFYFVSPEGHKFEICTWEPYPIEKAQSGRVDWPRLAHNWPNL